MSCLPLEDKYFPPPPHREKINLFILVILNYFYRFIRIVKTVFLLSIRFTETECIYIFLLASFICNIQNCTPVGSNASILSSIILLVKSSRVLNRSWKTLVFGQKYILVTNKNTSPCSTLRYPVHPGEKIPSTPPNNIH